MAMEDIHSDMYGLLIESYIKIMTKKINEMLSLILMFLMN